MENQTDVGVTTCGQYLTGDTAYVLFNCVILLLMIPGFSFFYSGQTQIGSSVTILALPFLSIVIITLQWWLVGHSLAFSKTSSWFIGDFSNVFLQGVYDCTNPEAPKVPEMVFSLYQCITAMIPAVILIGAVAERGRVFPAAIFILLWTTLVYDVVCYWSLNPNGWSFRMGLLDYGGASPVHVPAGMTAIAITRIVSYPSSQSAACPHGIRCANQVVFGTILIWLGSFGNMAGGAMSANSSGIFATVAVGLAGSSGAMTWSLIEYWWQRKASVLGSCNGALVGLAAITPCGGFISPSSSISVGVITAIVCYVATQLKEKYKFNDVMEIVVIHGVSGAVGSILTGILSQNVYGGKGLEEDQNGGWMDGNWIQVPIQLLDIIAAGAWSFSVSYIILFTFTKIKFLKLRVSEQVELAGLDKFEATEDSFERQIFETLKSELMIREKTHSKLPIITIELE